jgi:hypothetical protein
VRLPETVSIQTCPPKELLAISPVAPTVPAAGFLKTARIFAKLNELYTPNFASVVTSSVSEFVFKLVVLSEK